MTTSKEVAQWMVNEIIQSGQHGVSQSDIVFEIESQFGPSFVYDNENGNPAISRPVLAEFKRLHGGRIEWERAERAWYPR
ncbi:hypothetical protein JVX90_04250 [Gordonia sp. PDNC005]|uniref:DUF6953 family protein n=1 Tax=Gordonia sp. PDNC005 TaxID=2811424 RepID=UPI00196634AC|nr:hypothetical protein [Gordonia sp. PDNC005]QRY63451.1 hypothetical protein JVX90_04250 [Gordonia sp. PDNC005]